MRPGVYVAGWVKRGPTGFIGTNKTCAQETVEAMLDDLDAGLPTPVGTRDSIASVVRGRCPDVVDLAGWLAIDAEERRRGAERGRAAGQDRRRRRDGAGRGRVPGPGRAAVAVTLR